MDFYKLLWDLFSIMCQGSVAGLIILYFTIKYQKHQDTRRLRNQALLLLAEIELHLLTYEAAYKNQDIDKNNCVFLSHEWENAKSLMCTIEPEYFKEIMTHYYWLLPMQGHFNFSPEKLLDADGKRHLANCYNRGAAIHSALKAIAYPDKKHKYIQRYKERIARCSDKTVPEDD